MELQLPAVLTANEAYQRGGSVEAGRKPQPSRHLVILTCMDARLDLFPALGLQVGDAHILRNAGGRATADAIRSLVVSAHMLDTREVGVIHHTKCGLQGRTQAEIAAKTGTDDIEFLAFADLEQSVVADVKAVRTCGKLPPDFAVWGAVYDVDTGSLQVVIEPQAA